MNNKTFKIEMTPVLRCQSVGDKAPDEHKDPEGLPAGEVAGQALGSAGHSAGSGHLRVGIESWVGRGALKETEEIEAAGHCGRSSP